MNPIILFAGAIALIVAGLVIKESSFTAVGLGLMWMGLAIVF